MLGSNLLIFRLTSVARQDVLGVVDFYAGVDPAVAEAFVNEFEAALQDLCNHPVKGSRRYAHLLPDRALRVWQLERFPFLIFYRRQGKTLEVLRVLHERRDLAARLISI